MSGTRYFAVFLAVLIAGYVGGHLWLYFRCLRWFPHLAHGGLRVLIGVVFAGLALSYPLGRLLDTRGYADVAATLEVIGSLWLGLFMYTMMGLLILEVLRAVGVRLPARYCALLLVVFATALCGYGYHCATHPKITRLSFSSPKISAPLTVVFVSDLHLGVMIGQQRLQAYVEMIRDLNPDVILIGGDVVDESVPRVVPLVETLRTLQAPDGVYAVTGNHDYYAGVDQSIALMQQSGFRVLRGEQVNVRGITIVGIDDVTGTLRYGEQQPELSALLRSVDHRQFILLVSHQPRNLRQAAAAGVDLTLSGHTHNGQLWPFGYITGLVFPDLHIGSGRFDQMDAYVSSGLGTWGPPLRIGATPEVVAIQLSPI